MKAAGDAVEGEEAVVGELGLVFGKAHLDAPVERHPLFHDTVGGQSEKQ